VLGGFFAAPGERHAGVADAVAAKASGYHIVPHAEQLLSAATRARNLAENRVPSLLPGRGLLSSGAAACFS